MTFTLTSQIQNYECNRDQFCCYVSISKIRKGLLFRHTVLFCLFKTDVKFVNILTFLQFRLLYVCVMWFYTTWWQHVVKVAKVICSKSGFKKLNNFFVTKLLKPWTLLVMHNNMYMLIFSLPPQTTTTADYTYV